MTTPLFFLFGVTIVLNQLIFSVKANLFEVASSRSDRSDRSEFSRTLAYSMRLGKIDYMLENMNRRIEAIETKLNHFEVRMDVQMEKIEEAVLAKDLKGEFATEQLSRKIDNLGEKVMNKLAFLEAKASMKIDNLNSRFERSERHLQHSLEGLMNKLGNADDKQVQSESHMWTDLGQVEEINNSIQDLKSFITREVADTVTKKLQEIGEKVDTGFQEVDNELENGQITINDLKTAVIISNGLAEESIKLLEIKLNTTCDSDNSRGRSGGQQSQPEILDSHSEDINVFATRAHEQLDNITSAMGVALRMGEQKFKELDNDVEIYTKKVLNAYYELLKGSREMEQYLSSTMAQGNQTRLAVQDGFRRVYHQLRPLTALEPKIEDLVDGLELKILDLSTTVDSSFATLLVAQNAFIASCHRIQQQEPQIEHRIHDAIHKIIQQQNTGSSYSSNGTLVNEDSHCRHESMLGDLLWTLFNIGNQTRDNMSALITRIASLERAFASSSAHSRCMIGTGDWNSLSQACGFMHGRAMGSQSNSTNKFLSAITRGTKDKQTQSLTSSSSHALNSHLPDSIINNASRPLNGRRQPALMQKHSTSVSSEYTEPTDENTNKGQLDYDYEEYLDDYPDQ